MGGCGVLWHHQNLFSRTVFSSHVVLIYFSYSNTIEKPGTDGGVTGGVPAGHWDTMISFSPLEAAEAEHKLWPIKF